MSDLHSQFPHLFNTTYREPIQMQFELWQAPPQDDLISNVNLVPYVGDKWLIIQVDNTFWELPGGTREPNEPYAETLKRDLLEEAGVRVRSITSLGAWHCHSNAPKPYRPHLPHPDFYRYVSYGEVEIVGKPLNPSDAEQVTLVELVPLQEAIKRYRSIGREDFAELYALAAWARDQKDN
jgi:8-oxo-dGTP pyrophosphatase MutT (NUDIX family)